MNNDAMMRIAEKAMLEDLTFVAAGPITMGREFLFLRPGRTQASALNVMVNGAYAIYDVAAQKDRAMVTGIIQDDDARVVHLAEEYEACKGSDPRP